jgi:hypothetical protein
MKINWTFTPKSNARVFVEDEEGALVKLIDTTTGRVIFNEVVPEGVPYINELLTKKNLKKVISDVTRKNRLSSLQSSWMISRKWDSCGHSKVDCLSTLVT